MNFTLCLTHDCNLDCTYCYSGRKSPASMTDEVISQTLNFAFSQVNRHMQLGFFGGEPLLEWKKLESATLTAEKMAESNSVHLIKTVTTNGTLVNNKRAKWLFEHSFIPAISIDGNKRMHDICRKSPSGKSTFAATLKGLRHLLPLWPDLEVIVVVTPENISLLAEGVSYLCEDEKVVRISISPDFYTQWSDGDMAEMKRQFNLLGDYYIRRYRSGNPVYLSSIDSKIITHLKGGFESCDKCGFGSREIAVAPSGRIYPCERLVGEDSNDEMCIGTVFEGFDSPRRSLILNNLNSPPSECKSCAVVNRCMNWCGCINYQTTGFVNSPGSIVCFHEQTVIEVADRCGNILYSENNEDFINRYYGQHPEKPVSSTTNCPEMSNNHHGS